MNGRETVVAYQFLSFGITSDFFVFVFNIWYMRSTFVHTFSGEFVRGTFASCTFRQQLLKFLFSSGVRSAAAKFGTLHNQVKGNNQSSSILPPLGAQAN